VDFGMVAPRRLDPARYAVVGPDDLDWFQWPAVEGDRNIRGHEAICIPGAVAGLGLAAEHFGRLPWPALIEPALELAEAGVEIDWYASLSIAVEAKGLASCPTSRSIYLPDGGPPVTRERTARQHLRNPALAGTLRRLAETGPEDFYRGDIARRLVADLAAGGSVVDKEDLAAYRARLVEPEALDYRGTRLHTVPGLTGGPAYRAALRRLAATVRPGTAPDGEAFLAYAEAITQAYAVRLQHHGHAASEQAAARAPDCTSHVSVIDRDGNMASLTNSLLSRFGAKVTLPATGILMNNGMMWFDPRPGRPNAIGAGRRPLANMCPVLATSDGAPCFVLGAAGGRQIVPALVQLTSFLLDFELTLEQAFHVPRLDASSSTILCDNRMPGAQLAAVARRFPVSRVADTVYPVQFAVPTAVQVEAISGRRVGMAHVTTPWPSAVAEDFRS
jgi:gamma-glutamyltranspeptidase/glutathione hydrolase